MNANRDIIKTKGQMKGSHTENPVAKNGKTTKTLWETYDVEYQRAAFQLTFSPGYKGGDDDYMLSSNPCWPKSVLPNDPGFNLLTDDPWYKHAQPEATKYTKSYGVQGDIPQELLAKAGQKRPASPGTPKRKRDDAVLLEVLDDGLAIRDGNNTRRITDDEVKRDIEITTCEDHDCLKERRALAEAGDDSYVVFPGDPPPKEPSANADTVATAVPRHAREFPVQKRSDVSPDLPRSTGAGA